MPGELAIVLGVAALWVVPMIVYVHQELGDRKRMIEHVAGRQGEFLKAVEIPLGGGPFSGYRRLQRVWLIQWKGPKGEPRQSWMRAAWGWPDEWEDL